MKMLLLALALVVQAPTPPSPPERPPLPDEDPQPAGLSPAHDLFYEDAGPSPPEARRAVEQFGGCVAGRSRGLSREVLLRDFTTRSYRSGLRQLARVNEDCFGRRGAMRSSSLLFAGAIAEALLEREPEPLNARLARAALRPATPARSPSDQIAICVVRSVPDEVTALFATEVASEAETAAIRALGPVANLCNRDGYRLEINPAGLRAMLATAAFRSVNDASSAGGSE